MVALGIFAVIGTVRRITETGRGWKFAQLGSQPRKGKSPGQGWEPNRRRRATGRKFADSSLEIMRSNNGGRLEKNRKFVDSPLEGTGFELPVPRKTPACGRSLRAQRVETDPEQKGFGMRQSLACAALRSLAVIPNGPRRILRGAGVAGGANFWTHWWRGVDSNFWFRNSHMLNPPA